VATQHTAVREDDMIARGAIVSDVCTRHNKIIFTNPCRAAFSGCSVNGDVFTNDRGITDAHIRRGRRIKMKVLGVSANNGEMIHFYFLSKHGTFFDDSLCANFTFMADYDIRFDNRQWPNNDSVS
jgi:hypothetical protein